MKSKKKMYVKISVKLSLLVLAAFILMSAPLNFSSLEMNKAVVGKLYRQELKSVSSSLQNLLDAASTGDYIKSNGIFYKGDRELSSFEKQLTAISTDSKVHIALFYGTECMTASIKKDIIPINETTYQTFKKTGAFYTKVNHSNKEEYFCYYVPLKQPSSGEIIGAMRVGIPTKSMRLIYRSSRMLLYCLRGLCAQNVKSV